MKRKFNIQQINKRIKYNISTHKFDNKFNTYKEPYNFNDIFKYDIIEWINAV